MKRTLILSLCAVWLDLLSTDALPYFVTAVAEVQGYGCPGVNATMTDNGTLGFAQASASASNPNNCPSVPDSRYVRPWGSGFASATAALVYGDLKAVASASAPSHGPDSSVYFWPYPGRVLSGAVAVVQDAIFPQGDGEAWGHIEITSHGTLVGNGGFGFAEVCLSLVWNNSGTCDTRNASSITDELELGVGFDVLFSAGNPIFLRAALGVEARDGGAGGNPFADFGSTAHLSITPPPGFTYTSESGLLLTQAQEVPTPNAVAEPASLALLGIGFAVVGAARRRTNTHLTSAAVGLKRMCKRDARNRRGSRRV